MPQNRKLTVRGKDGKFLPGNKFNPGGKPKLPPELRLKIAGYKEKIYYTVISYGEKPVQELEQLKNDKSIPGLDRMIIGVMYKAFNGNIHAIEYLTQMFIGKPKEAIELSGQEGKELFASMTKEEFIQKGEAVIQRLKVNLKAIERGKHDDK